MAESESSAIGHSRKAPAVAKALRILEYLARSQEALGVVPLARQTEMVPSTCLHILRSLDEEGLVMSNPKTKQYSIGAGILTLARAYVRQDKFVQRTQEMLDVLSKKYACSFYATERCNAEELIVVAIGDSQADLSVRVAVGSRFPLYVSSAGMCFAANDSGSEEAIYERFCELMRAQSLTLNEWCTAIRQVRESGFAIDDGHFIPGSIVVSVPAFDGQGNVLGCLSAVAIRDRVQEGDIELIVADLQMLASDSPAPPVQPTNARRNPVQKA